MENQEKCYFCSRKENLKKDSIQRGGKNILVVLCPQHYAEQEKLREMVRQNHRAQFGDNWH